MKFLIPQVFYLVSQSKGRRNLLEMAKLGLGVLAFVIISSFVFHWVMGKEPPNPVHPGPYEWYDGFYWTLVTMSTLGYGDIVFKTALGKFFSLGVMLFGMVTMLGVLPFMFIRFIYEPWIESQRRIRTPRELPPDTRDHVILTHYDHVTQALTHKLDQYGHSYALLLDNQEEVMRLHERGLSVAVGPLDDPDTYRKMRVDQAAMVVATGTDATNANIANTVRELVDHLSIITTAKAEASVDILELAGSTRVIRLGEMMGQFLARRTLGNDALAHVIGHFDQLLIAEATTTGTPLVGKTLAECNFRETVGMSVVGIWDRGHFGAAGPSTRINEHTVLIFAGSKEQIRAYNELFCIYHVEDAPVLIIGGGRVGRATSRALARRGMHFRVIEEMPERIRDANYYVEGNAARIEVLEKAGIHEASTVIITTGDDDTNIYLTIYCRKLRPNIQIISRATVDRNVSTLHRAGADFVMSYASMGANIIFNLLKRSDILMVAEGLNVFRIPIPESLAEKTIADTGIRSQTGSSIIAIQRGKGKEEKSLVNPGPGEMLQSGDELVLIGDLESEENFVKDYLNS